MKRITIILLFCLATIAGKAQNDIDGLLAAGVEDTQRFTNDYLAPGTNGLMYSINANWFNTAVVKPLGGFEISVIANAATIGNENKSFLFIICFLKILLFYNYYTQFIIQYKYK